MADKKITKIEHLPKIPSLNDLCFRKRRVAAYARVSTALEEQESSLAAQKDYYEKYIQENKDWVFAGIYYDDGISGLSYVLPLHKKPPRPKKVRFLTEEQQTKEKTGTPQCHRLTQQEKTSIIEMRKLGYTYKRISEIHNVNINTIKTFVSRHGSDVEYLANQPKLCKNCGSPIEQAKNGKPKIFCCNECRSKWWAANKDKGIKRTQYTITCANCGIEFKTSARNRKYCSIGCYNKVRCKEQL